MPRAQEVIGAWAAPGGPDAASWSVVRGLSLLLSAADNPPPAPELQLRADPAMGSRRSPRAPDT